MSNFFKHFPSFDHPSAGRVRNITARVAIDFSNSVPQLPYDQQPGMRADVLADLYYDDPSKDWLVYLSNNVIDPLTEQLYTDSQATYLIGEKFGSVENAGRKIHHWISNWRADDSSLSSNLFNALPSTVKQLYNPVVDYRGNVTAYMRKQEDIIRPTSMYLAVTIEENDLVAGDLIDFVDGITIGTGEVLQLIDSTHLVIHHIQELYQGAAIRKFGGTAQYSFTVGQETPCIDVTEAAYFEPESEYDYFIRMNEAKRKLRLVDKRFASLAQDQVESKLQ